MIKKGLIIGVVAIMTLVALSTVLISDDSAAGTKVYSGATIEVDGKNEPLEVKIYLKTKSDTAPTDESGLSKDYLYFNIGTNSEGEYGTDPDKKIAFVSRGVKDDRNNLYPNGTIENWDGVLEIPDIITVNGDEYYVVGIRNNAFKGNEYLNENGNSYTDAEKKDPNNWRLKGLKTVEIPATMMAIGINNGTFLREETGSNGCCFSKSQNLDTVVIKTDYFDADGKLDENGEERSLLDFIGYNTFQDTKVEELDFSKCKDVTIRGRTVGIQDNLYAPDSPPPFNLKKIDISGANKVESGAFCNCDLIVSIVMPTSGTIALDAFKKSGGENWVFYDEDGNEITNPVNLQGLVFKVAVDPVTKENVMVSTYKVTYVMNGGVEPSNSHFLEGDALPIPTKAGYDFYLWYDVMNGAFLDDGKMPKADVTLSAYWIVDVPAAEAYSYDGFSHTPYSDNAIYTVSGDVTEVDAGGYKAKLTLVESFNVWRDGIEFYANGVYDRTWSISTVDAAATVTGASNKDYTGNDLNLIGTASCDGGELWYYTVLTANAPANQAALDAVPSSKWKTVAQTKDAGDYTVFWKIIPDKNHNGLAPLLDNKVTAKINKATITVKPDSNQSKVYGTSDPAFTYTYSGQIGSEVPGFTGALARAAGDIVGVYAINIGDLALADGQNGFLASNYELVLDSTPVDFSITPATITVSGITAEDKIYNGNLEAVLNYLGAVFAGVFAGDDVTLESATGVFADKNVGNNKTVTIGNYVLGGKDKDNYELTTQSITVTADITPATITVSGITVSDKVFDGKASATIDESGMVLDGKIGDDKIAVGAVGEFVDRNVGDSKTVNIALGLEGTDAGNYVLASYTMTLAASITPATITGDIEQDGSLTYDGTPLRADVYSTLVSVADEEISVTYSLAADGVYSKVVPSFTEVGDHTVYYIAEAANHEIKTGSFTVTISAPHNSDVEGGDHVLLLLFGGIAVVAGAMLVAPFIFGRP